jgi:hypothetical protein
VLREAELFAFAGEVLVEVLGRIRETDRDIPLPLLTGLSGPSEETALWSVVEQYAYDDACVPGVLAGDEAGVLDREQLRLDLDGAEAQAVIARGAEAASAAARAASDGDQLVHASYGVVSTRHYLLRLTVNRSFLAHYVAFYLGSTACPLPEELARPMLELTQPDAAQWRALGIFREPMPVPHLASWRDTFLLTAGHLPHPLGH